jgi:hypothetical protein
MVPKINFQINITPAEARVTDRFPVAPEVVVDAYRRTGLKPVRGIWLERDQRCACALGVLCADSNLTVCGTTTLVNSLNEVDVHDVLAPDAQDLSMASYLLTFAQAFDIESLEDLGQNVASVVQATEPPMRRRQGWEILAWRNALAVRHALAAANLEPGEAP